MRKWILGIGTILIISISIGSWYCYHLKEEKYSCSREEDCILSLTDPEDFQICVNSGYYAKAKKEDYQCLMDDSLSCKCIQNRCIRSDQKVGCK